MKKTLSEWAKGGEVPEYVLAGAAKLAGWDATTELTEKELQEGVDTFTEGSAPTRPAPKGK